MKMRIELTRSRNAAQTQAGVLLALGFKVTDPEACEVVWVNDPEDGPLVTYADPSDKEAWVVIGRK